MDTQYQYRHFCDLARRALVDPQPQYTRFLDPALELEAQRAAREENALIEFFGGYPDAERRMARYAAEPYSSTDWPILCVRLEWNSKFSTAGHRDLLGAVMALGMERDCVGDIVPDSDCAHVFALPDAAAYIAANLESAGRAKIKASIVRAEIVLPEPKGRMVRDTVSSLRLDALIAGAYSLSRAEATKIIERELVRVNHMLTTKPGHPLDEGDLVSVRGYGRFRFAELEGATRKGRMGVKLFVYGR